MKTTFYFRLSIFAAIALLLYGCSELKKGAVPPTSPVFVYVHPDGFGNSSSPNFHPNTIQQAGYEIRDCRQCHGGNYTGATALSCVSSKCHVDANGNAKSPESCNTCHGTFSGDPGDTLSWAPPRSLSGDTLYTARGVGAHFHHLESDSMRYSTSVGCSTCHTIPSSVYAAGHMNGSAPAQVVVSGSIATTPSGGISPSPSYDAQSLRCSNTFCHGNWRLRKANSQNTFIYTDSVIVGANYSPLWTGGTAERACGTCHGLPPTGHLNISGAKCTACHYLTNQYGPLDKTTHINGKIDLYGKEYSFK